MAKADPNPRIIQRLLKQKSEEAETLAKRGYRPGRTLGEGTYAKVKIARSERHGKKVAIKIIALDTAPRKYKEKFLPRELHTLRILDHPRIIKLLDLIRTNNYIYVVTELAGHGDLLDYVRLLGFLPEEKAKPLFRQIVDAISYCHSRNIVHRDLKCENILLDEKNNIKITDFGFARILHKSEQSQTYCGSAAYTSPEILSGTPYVGPPTDIWSMGVILYIMVTGLMPYTDDNLGKLMNDQKKKVKFNPEVPSDCCKQLIRSMLEYKVRRRATMDAIQSSSWLKMVVKMSKNLYTRGQTPIPVDENPYRILQVDSEGSESTVSNLLANSNTNNSSLCIWD